MAVWDFGVRVVAVSKRVAVLEESHWVVVVVVEVPLLPVGRLVAGEILALQNLNCVLV